MPSHGDGLQSTYLGPTCPKLLHLPDVVWIFAITLPTGSTGTGAVTVSFAFAEADPPSPAAVAVYVVAVAGLTAWVPPLDDRVYLLPSVPLTVTWVEFVAVTVNVDELPAVMEAGLAAMLTVGAGVAAGPDAGGAVTVRIAFAEADPPSPVAVAVYVVAVAGLTEWVPPFDDRLYLLPSPPITVTWVEFVAVTVNVDELPGVMEAGLAVMLTAGAGAVAGGVVPESIEVEDGGVSLELVLAPPPQPTR